MAEGSGKHGDYSRYSPTKWIHSLERAAKDPQLLDLRRDIELAESGLNEALERMDLGISDDRSMAKIVGSIRTLLSALDRNDEQTSGRMLNELPELIEATRIDADIKREVIKWMGVRPVGSEFTPHATWQARYPSPSCPPLRTEYRAASAGRVGPGVPRALA